MFLSFVLIGGFGLVLICVFWATWENGSILVTLPLVVFCITVGVLVNWIVLDNENSVLSVDLSDNVILLPTLDSISPSLSSDTAVSSVVVRHLHIPDLLSQAMFKTAQFPAVFVCGPTSLLQAIRGAVSQGKKMNGNYSCFCGRFPMCEEAFKQ